MYKIRPIRRQVRALMAERGVTVAEQLVGISLDEVHRMRTNDVGYLRNVYPLVDLRMTRADCLVWLYEHGHPRPPKSACLGCPYHGDAQWRDLRDTSPTEWADVVTFDAALRRGQGDIRDESYLHRSLVPINQADIRSEQERGQMEMFGNECSGLCGV